MKTQPINIIIAESSPIVRMGLNALLKKIPDAKIQVTDISSIEGLAHCMRGHDVDIVLINPTFEGWFNLKEFKTQFHNSNVKFVAILYAVTDASPIKDYDDKITLFETHESLYTKLVDLMHFEEENAEDEQETLSDREKEIICYVVKGMTNKEIAEQLYISVHTVITHRRNISKKLQIHSSAGLTIYAIVNKLVELSDVKL